MGECADPRPQPRSCAEFQPTTAAQERSRAVIENREAVCRPAEIRENSPSYVPYSFRTVDVALGLEELSD